MLPRHLLLRTSASYKTRTEQYQGREHIVVPVVALVQGVLHAMNASSPEFVAAEEIRSTGWDGRPIFVGHPTINGIPVPGNTPSILETKQVGTVFASAVKKNKLTMEAWIDVARAAEISPTLLSKVQAGETIEISVGIYCETTDESGTYQGKKYAGAWTDIVPDHLALLPEDDDLGACSREMGCGVRAAASYDVQEAVMSEPKPKKTSMLAKMLSLFRASQPAGEMSDGDLRKKLSAALSEAGVRNLNYVEAFIPVTNPTRVVYSCYIPAMGYDAPGNYEMYERAFTLSDTGVVTIGEAEIEVEPVVYYEPVLMEQEVVAAAGKRNSTKDQAKIQSMHDHATALGAYCDPKMATQNRNASAGASCSCGGHTAPKANTQPTEAEMKKEEIVKALENATEDVLARVAAAIEGPKTPTAEEVKAAADAKAAADKEAADKVAADKVAADKLAAEAAAKPVEMTREQAIEKFGLGDAVKVMTDRKAATVKALMATGRCDLTEAQLTEKSQADLDQLVKLAGSNVRQAIDFGGQGSPRVAETTQAAPVAPSLSDALKAANAKK
jgi:hypothetical protein